MTTTTPREKLEAKIAGQTTAMLQSIAIQMYATDAPNPDDAAAWQLTRGLTVDELLRRHPAADAQMDAWMGDETDEGLKFICEHTYGELAVLACDLTKRDATPAATRPAEHGRW